MKDILAIVAGAAHDESRLASATLIAAHFNAVLTIAVINELTDPQIYAADPALGVASTAEAIIAEIRRLDADFLVMGAQAGGGVRQWFTSSVSRKVLPMRKLLC